MPYPAQHSSHVSPSLHLGRLGACGLQFLVVLAIMASSHGRGSSSPGHSSFSSLASVDSDNDTDLDDTEAEGLHLPFLNQRAPRQSSGQDPRHEKSTSLPPELQYDYGGVRPHSPQHYPTSGEDKQYFDSFWADFREKQRQRTEASDTYINTEHTKPTERSVDDIMNGRDVQPHTDNHAYGYPRHRLPLVSLIRNGWQSDSRRQRRSNSPSGDPGSPTVPTISQILSAPRPRRWLFILLALLSLCLYWWWHGAQAWREHKLLKGAVKNRMQSDLGYFGTNMLPEFAGMTHLRSLDVGLVPRIGDNKRLIVIGDVHGCVVERTYLKPRPLQST